MLNENLAAPKPRGHGGKVSLVAAVELTLAMITVGSSVVVGKILVTEFPVFLASGLRYGLSAVLLVPLLTSRERLPKPTARETLLLFIQAFTGVFLFSICLLYGLRHASAAESGLITATTPAVMALISFLWLRERLGLAKIAGILLAVGGIAVIHAGKHDAGSASSSLFGSLLIFAAVIGEALFTIVGKVVSERLSPLFIATVMVVLGFIFFLPFAIAEARHFNFSVVTARGWSALIYYSLVVTVLGFLLWYRGVAKVDASTAAVFTGVLPVSALVLAHFVLDEELTVRHAVGMAMVLGAIIFVARDAGGPGPKTSRGLRNK